MRNKNKYLRRLEGKKKVRKVVDIMKKRSCHTSPETKEKIYGKGGSMEKYLFRNRAKCSCSMCGNPRKHFKKITLQEIKSELEMIEEIIEERQVNE